MGAGTGLGECYLTPAVGTGIYSCFPSEGGHVEYAPRNALESKLWEYLRTKFPTNHHRISVERIVSGKGLANVYEFLAHEFAKSVDPKIHEAFLQAGDEQGRIVAEHVGKNRLCQQSMDIMMSAYGCHVGSAAITFLPVPTSPVNETLAMSG